MIRLGLGRSASCSRLRPRSSTGRSAATTSRPDESGSHTGEPQPSSNGPIGTGSPPSSGSTWSCAGSRTPPARYARLRPSGEKRGLWAAWARVSRRCASAGLAGPRHEPDLRPVGIGRLVAPRHDVGRPLPVGMDRHVGHLADAEEVLGHERPGHRRILSHPRRGGTLVADARADADRRQLVDLPGVLRPPARHGDGVGPGHECGVRLHVDAHQPAAGPSTRRDRGGVRPARADVPPRADRDLQGQPQRRARHPPPADRPRPPGDRDVAHPDPRGAGVRGRRRDRHDRHPCPRRGASRHRGHRRPRQLPAGRGPARQGALQPPGRLRLRPLRRGRHRGAHRRPPRPLRPVRRAAGRHLRQPAGRAGRGREDGGQADQHVRRPRRCLRQPRVPDPEAAGVARRQRGERPPQRPGHGAGARRTARGRARVARLR